VVWHHSLSKTQCASLEAIQHRAICLIFPVPIGMPYIFSLDYARISCLHSCCEEANKRFFRSMSLPLACFPLLSTWRDGTVTSRLRSAAVYPRSATRTKQSTSSVQYFLLNYYQQTGFTSSYITINIFSVLSQHCCVSFLFIVFI